MAGIFTRVWRAATLAAASAVALPGLAAAPQITWIVYDFPPGFILSGRYAGTGTFDLELRYFTAHLPGYSHRIVAGSFARAWYEIAHRDGVCVIGAGRTPARTAVAKFSQVAFATTPVGVILRTDRLERFRPFMDGKGQFDLTKLGQAGELRGDFIPGRVYTAAIDALIASPERQVKLDPVPSMDVATRSVSELHADFVFGYSHELAFYRVAGRLGPEVSWVPIKGQPRLLFSHIACSAGPLGSSVILKVDKIIGGAGLPPDYTSLEAQWTSPAELASLYDPTIWERIRRDGFPTADEVLYEEERQR